MKRTNETMIVAGALITLLGVLLLLTNLGILPLEKETVCTIMLSVSAVAFALSYSRGRQQWWALMVACILGLMVLERTLPSLAHDQRRFIRGASLCAVGALFLGAFLRQRQQWWWLIPSGVLFTLGVTALLRSAHLVRGGYHGVLFFTGLGLTFGVLYLLGRQTQSLRWAQYPAVSLLAVAALLLLGHAPRGDELVVPLCLLAVGLFLVTRNLRRLKSRGQASPEETA
ncbi:MAG: hypothetical protein QHJ34_15150 [bacterium]|jgi:hypothetical protein|nr:hypothetical protein [candidate division KSB1 bacterium]MDH7561539.1 hypothetical protein [bacterium]